MSNSYNTNKTNNDPILESRNTKANFVLKKPKNYLGFPFFQTNLMGLLDITLHKLESNSQRKSVEPLYILPIDPYQLIRLRLNKKYTEIAQASFINLPVGSGICWMSRVLGNPIPSIVPTVSYVMSLLRLAEAKNYSIFLIGGSQRGSEKLFFNLKHAFPNLLIMGRHHGEIIDEEAKLIRQAWNKIKPDIILMDLGNVRGLNWMKNYKSEFNSSIVVNMSNEFNVLAGFKKAPPNFFKKKHLVWFWNIFKNPFLWYRFFSVFYWFFLINVKRIKKSNIN